MRRPFRAVAAALTALAARYVAGAAAAPSIGSPATEDPSLQALLALYNATNGPSWTSSQFWGNVSVPYCEWQGVECDAGGSVIKLHLDELGLAGTLPPELGLLANLTGLEVSNNLLSGALPASLGSLRALSTLRLSGNYFTGLAILCNLQALQNLELMENGLTNADLPDCLGDLPRLSSFDVSLNRLSGPVPQFIARMRALDTLGISFNALTGEVPAWLASLPLLRNLNFAANSFTGALPDELGALSVAGIDGSQNRLTTFPAKQLCAWAQTISAVVLSANSFGGVVGDCGSNTSFPQLNELALDGNRLSGEIPAWVWSAPQLTELNLESNAFSGTLPLASTQQPLELLNLRGNALSGTLPAWILSLPRLSELRLSDNAFSGALPTEIPTSIKLLSIARTAISGAIPQQLVQGTSLNFLDLSGNLLAGSLPHFCGGAPSIRVLKLSDNAGLNDTLAAAVGKLLACTSLQSLDLSRTGMSGTVPLLLWEGFPMLSVLELSDCGLQGPMPMELIAKASLNVLDLSYNALSAAFISGAQVVQQCQTLTPNRRLARLDLSFTQLLSDPLSAARCFALLTDGQLSELSLAGATLSLAYRFEGNQPYFSNLASLNVSGAALRVDKAEYFVLYLTEVVSAGLSQIDLRGNPQVRLPDADSLQWNQPVVQDADTGLFCLQPSVLTTTLASVRVLLEPASTLFYSCQCDMGSVWALGNSSCQPCIANAFCAPQAATAATAPDVALVVSEGFYPVDRVSGALVQSAAQYHSLADIVALECVSRAACNPGVTAAAHPTYFTFACAEGHDPASMLCSRCLPGYYHAAGRCERCPVGAHVWMPLLLVAFACAALAWAWRMEWAHGTAAVSIGVFFLQLMHALDDSTAAASSQQPAAGLSVFSSVTALLYVRPFAPECLSATLQPDALLWFYLALPVALAAACACAGLVASLLAVRRLSAKGLLLEGGGPAAARPRVAAAGSEGDGEDEGGGEGESRLAAQEAADRRLLVGRLLSARVRGRFFFLFFLVFLPLAQTFLQAFNCTRTRLPGADGAVLSYLAAWPWVACGSSEHGALLVGASLGVALYVVALPVLGVGLRVSRALRRGVDAEGVAEEFGFLWMAARAGLPYWELCVVTGRKLLVVVLLALLPFRSVFVPLAVLLTLIAALLMHVAARPYREQLDNVSDGALLAGAVAVYLAAVLSEAGSGATLHLAGLGPVASGVEAALKVVAVLLIVHSVFQRVWTRAKVARGDGGRRTSERERRSRMSVPLLGDR